MKKCFDAGTIQAFLDGELAAGAQETAARHIAACDACAARLAEAEEETAFAFSALERESNAPVPTERLWTKINGSIERENKISVWKVAFKNFKKMFASPLIAGFAGFLIFAAVFVASRSSRTVEENLTASRESKAGKEIVLAKRESEPVISPTKPDKSEIKTAAKKSLKAKDDNPRAVNADFVKHENNQKPNAKKSEKLAAPKSVEQDFAMDETTLVKTIAVLEKTVESRKDEVLKPAARFSFEKDLAVSDDAIARMKLEVKQNPKNGAAKKILLASYQNKIELLNSVAEKTQLMASLK